MAIALLAACAIAGGCGTTQTVSTDPNGSSTAGVTGITASAADKAGLAKAFATWEFLPATCPADAVMVVPGSLRLATINASGVSWAIASFEPSSNCMDFDLPGAGQIGRQPVDPHQLAGFYGSPLAVFERASGGQWVMDEEGGAPFPCPAPGGAAPGPGNGAIPLQVLTAWNLAYAANCSMVVYPREKR